MKLSKTLLAAALLLIGVIPVNASQRQTKIIPTAKFDRIEVDSKVHVSYTKGKQSDIKIEYPASLSEKISAYVDDATRTLKVNRQNIDLSQNNNGNEDYTIYVTCSSPELTYLKLGFSSKFTSESPISSSSAMTIVTESSSTVDVPGITAEELTLSNGFSSRLYVGNVTVNKQLTIDASSSSVIQAKTISSKSGSISIADKFSSKVDIESISTPDVCSINVGSSSRFIFGSISAGGLSLETEFASSVTLCSKISEVNITGNFIARLSSSSSLLLPGRLYAKKIDMSFGFSSNARINEIEATDNFDLKLGSSSTFTAASVSASTLHINSEFSSDCNIFNCKVNKLYSRPKSSSKIDIRGLKANIVDIKGTNGSVTLSGQTKSCAIITSETSRINIDNLKVGQD